ncbi:MAG: type II toxin-antitoxin system VapC family toxin [Xanthobacteraceae bacterium]
MPDKPRIYLDSCCFIDMVKHEVGIALSSDRENDVWHMKQLLQAARDGETAVFTSTLAIAECTTADGQVTDKIKDVFTRLLTSGQYVVLVQPTPFIMADARDLRWVHSLTLRGADAVHIASALDRKCEEYITTDDQAKKLAAKQKLSSMGLRVICGRETTCLPQKYRQGSFNV